MTLATVMLVFGIGLLIGTVGLGGFIMVPVLMLLEGTTVRQAVVIAAIAFLASGIVSLALWRRHPGADAGSHRLFFLCAAPGAALGALLVAVVLDRVLALVIATAFAGAAMAEWMGVPRDASRRVVGPATAAAGGTFTGFASALTGTSGPMIALPLLSLAGVPMRERIAVAQVAQIPIALGATLVFAGLGEVPWQLAAVCSAALCIGLVVGARGTSRVDPLVLRRLAALLMLAAAIGVLMKAAL
jgi:uncharacterized membrane protein YfcA